METIPQQLELFDPQSYAATPCHVDMTEGRQELPNVVGVNFTPQGLIVADAATMQTEEFNAIFRSVIRFAKASNWLLGDTLLLCERRWGVPQVQSKNAEGATWEVPKDAPQDYLDMLDSERRVYERGKWVWKQIQNRVNHYLLLCGAFCAGRWSGGERYHQLAGRQDDAAHRRRTGIHHDERALAQCSDECFCG